MSKTTSARAAGLIKNRFKRRAEAAESRRKAKTEAARREAIKASEATLREVVGLAMAKSRALDRCVPSIILGRAGGPNAVANRTPPGVAGR